MSEFTALLEWKLCGMPSIKMCHFISLQLMTINFRYSFFTAGNHLFTGINIGSRSVIYRWAAADLNRSSRTPLQTDPSPSVYVLKGTEVLLTIQKKLIIHQLMPCRFFRVLQRMNSNRCCNVFSILHRKYMYDCTYFVA